MGDSDLPDDNAHALPKGVSDLTAEEKPPALNVIDFTKAKQDREWLHGHAAHENGEAFYFHPYEHNEEASVGYILPQHSYEVIVMTQPEHLEGIMMSRASALKLGQELIDAAMGVNPEASAAETSDEDEMRWAEVAMCANSFVSVMLEKLRENRKHKGDREGWKNDDPFDLLDRVLEEAKELKAELRKIPSDPTAILREAADVANMAMMVADAASALVNRPEKKE